MPLEAYRRIRSGMLPQADQCSIGAPLQAAQRHAYPYQVRDEIEPIQLSCPQWEDRRFQRRQLTARRIERCHFALQAASRSSSVTRSSGSLRAPRSTDERSQRRQTRSGIALRRALNAMRRKLLFAALTIALFLAGFGVASFPALAELRTITITLVGGQEIVTTVDVPPGTPPEPDQASRDQRSDQEHPGRRRSPPTSPTPDRPATTAAPARPTEPQATRSSEVARASSSTDGNPQPEPERAEGTKPGDIRTPGRHPDRRQPDADARPPRPGSGRRSRTSSSTSSGSRPSCFRSTRPPAPSTASAGRSWRRSTRSRPTTAAT